MTENVLSRSDMQLAMERLLAQYPGARAELDFENPLELLIATILSAQCTDVRVNLVTPALFARAKTASDYAEMPIEELEGFIKTCGLYKSKAKNIKATGQILVEDFDGTVPGTREELVQLPGVGRKTANVVLSNAYGVPAFAVDTHVFRVANRIGLVSAKNVEETERQLMENIPDRLWIDGHHALIVHGRRVCKARKPMCDICTLNGICLYSIANAVEL